MSTFAERERIEKGLQQYGLNPQDWFYVKTTIDDESYLIRSKDDPEMTLLAWQNPKTKLFLDLELLSL